MRLTNHGPILDSGQFTRQELSRNVKKIFPYLFSSMGVHKSILHGGIFILRFFLMFIIRYFVFNLQIKSWILSF